MRTALFSPLYLDGLDKSGSDRFARNVRWVKWYQKIQADIGFDDIWMADNGSSVAMFNRFCQEHPKVKLARFNHLPRGEGENPYPYCWRALWFVGHLIGKGYDKIVIIDSDSFVVSDRLSKFTKECLSGWRSVWSNKYQFPMAEFQIINRDAFPVFHRYTSGRFEDKVGELMEKALPFTEVHKEFRCDRYGESSVPQHEFHDLYAQAPINLNLKYNL